MLFLYIQFKTFIVSDGVVVIFGTMVTFFFYLRKTMVMGTNIGIILVVQLGFFSCVPFGYRIVTFQYMLLGKKIKRPGF